jgi:hypothetical protein
MLPDVADMVNSKRCRYDAVSEIQILKCRDSSVSEKFPFQKQPKKTSPNISKTLPFPHSVK